jgi:hypothetical protein
MRWRFAACLGVASLSPIAWACSSSSAPIGRGDTLIVDVDATIIPSQPAPDAGAADSPFGTYYDDAPGAYSYSPLAVCSKCACEAGTYCFGGGTGYTSFSGACSGSSGLAVGCQPLPPACATTATDQTAECACIFSALKPDLSCTPECTQGKPLTVYCPVP